MAWLTEHPPFALPHKRFVKQDVLAKALKYLSAERGPNCRATYREAVWERRVPLSYAGDQEGHQFRHSTVWRWLSWLGSLKDLRQQASQLIFQKDPQANLHWKPHPIAGHKVRSEGRRRTLEHSEIGQTPQQRYQDGQKFTRQVDLQRALEFFLKRVERTVDRKHCDVQLEKCFFRVSDRGLRGDKVQVRYDPFAPLEKVFLYSLAGEYLGTAVRYQRELGAHGETPLSPKPGKPQHNYLDLLIDQHDQSLRQRSQGIDYRQVTPSRRWSFGDFAQTLAQLLGRRGGLSAFTSDELEALSKLYQRVACTAALLRQAVEQSGPTTA